jgi:hypothetical protein
MGSLFMFLPSPNSAAGRANRDAAARHNLEGCASRKNFSTATYLERKITHGHPLRPPMKSIIFLLLLSCTFSVASSAHDDQRDSSGGGVREYCGKSDGAQPKHEPFFWDCAHIQAASIHDLEIEVTRTYTVPDFVKDKRRVFNGERYYESNDPHYSRWMFVSETKAVRYRQLFDGASGKASV